MTAPPLRTALADTYPVPSNATLRTGMGVFWDFATGLLGLTGAAVDARASLGVTHYQRITGTVAASALTLGLAAGELEFRSATAGSGAISSVASGALSLVVPSGATLGMTSSVVARLWLAEINNAGTGELAVMNTQLANGQIAPVNEASLITTVAIGAGSASAGVWYSASARSNVAFRLVGYVDLTEATAGTYATAPSWIQGMGPGVKRPGEVVQEVPGSYATAVSNASNALVDTGLTATLSLTSAPNRVRYAVHQGGLQKASGANASMGLAVVRGSTVINTFENNILTTGDGTQITVAAGTSGIDAPGAVGSYTYKTQFINSAGTVTVQYSSARSTMDLQEIQA